MSYLEGWPKSASWPARRYALLSRRRCERQTGQSGRVAHVPEAADRDVASHLETRFSTGRRPRETEASADMQRTGE